MTIILSLTGLGLPSAASWAETTYTWEQIKQKNSREACWLVIDREVYDLTATLVEHRDMCEKYQLDDYCGKDATELWQKKEQGDDPHKRKSQLILQRSRIGKLIEASPASEAKPTKPSGS
jgi:cytochrome b involved in lipid metabolism